MINFNSQQPEVTACQGGGEMDGRVKIYLKTCGSNLTRVVGCGISARNSPVGTFALCMLGEKEIKK